MKLKYPGLITLTFLLLNCSDNRHKTPFGYRNDLKVSTKDGQPKDSGVFYFDPVSFRDTFPIPTLIAEPPYDTVSNIFSVPDDKVKKIFDIKIDSFALKWFSKELFGSGEPILSNYYLGKDIIRLTWLRSFHPRVIINFIKQGDKYSIETKLLNWTSRKEKIDNKSISNKEFDQLLGLLSQYNFYNSEEVDWKVPDADGSEWILEVHTKDGYHFLNKESPDFGRSNGIREIGEFMIKRSQASNEEIY